MTKEVHEGRQLSEIAAFRGELNAQMSDGVDSDTLQALVRGLSSIFSLAVLGIGCLWILRDPERQAWHDKVAGTYVVKVPRNWPL